MDKDRELIHRLLDGGASPEEKEYILHRMQEDPALKKEFDDLTSALRLVEESPRMPASAAFTSDVMEKLSKRPAPFFERLKDFFFRSRVLEWNVAAAVALAGVAAVAFTVLFQARNMANQEPVVTVRMSLYAPDARQVAVAGDFNKWKVDSHFLNRQDGGVWTIDIPLKPGVYSYMFVVDGEAWVTDPNAESYRDDGFGYKNSIVRVST